MYEADHAVPPHRGFRTTIRSRTWWPYLKRGLALVFFVAIAWLLVGQARTIDWMEVGKALGRLPLTVLFIAAVLSAFSYAIYTTFDLIGRSYTRHTLPARCVMLVAFISYAFNLNLGSLIGSVGFRYRLYTKFGLAGNVIARVLGLSMLTNWLGYFVLGGVMLCFFTPDLPTRWQARTAMLPYLGGGLLAVAGLYLLACALARQRRWHWRARHIRLPTARMALLQLVLAMLNWMVIAGAVFTLLQARIDYPTVLTVLLIAAVAGIIIHVPGGVGVLEAVFIAMLSARLPATDLLAGLLAYRAVYYLLPLALAALLFMRVEWRARSGRR